MQKVKKLIQSPLMLIVFMTIKLVTYYSLIDVTLTRNFLALGSILILLLLFFDFATSKLKHKSILFLILYTGFTILMFSDTMYFNYYNQTVSVKQLWQASNVAKVPSSFIATLIPASFILLLEIPFVFHYFRKYSAVWIEKYKITRKLVKRCRYAIVSLMLLIAINPLGAHNFIKINTVEFFTNHVNDLVCSVMKDVSASSVDEEEVMQEVNQVAENSSSTNYKGIAKGKNLIVIQVESLQNFVIGAKYNGKEITPNLNKLIGTDSLYFDHYYSNIGKGNTVDAEFSTLNSLYPVIDRECYSLYEDNTYNGLPWLMREQGYYSFAVHGYYGSFWNRENAYPYQGFQQFYSEEDLDSTEQIGLGISDKSMFAQAADIIVEQDEPFFAFLNTLTNHHPYELDESEYLLELDEEDEGTMFGRYLETVAYTDAAIGEFIEDLKAKGIYDNTVIALYGDHHGLNATMSENKTRMTEFLGKEYDFDEMFKVPLIIHVPGSDLEKTVSMTGGQIDFLPTIANLFDINIPQPYILGRDLLNSKDGFVAFTVYLFEGSFVKNNVMFEISREKLFDGSRAWNIDTGEELDISDYEDDYKQAIKLKDSSQYILKNDLMASMFDHNKTIKKDEEETEPTETNYPVDTLD
ncbi:MAG: LTA synthase family protein [bacterium]|nr:LTA synthase family protein [bacterium]